MTVFPLVVSQSRFQSIRFINTMESVLKRAADKRPFDLLSIVTHPHLVSTRTQPARTKRELSDASDGAPVRLFLATVDAISRVASSMVLVLVRDAFRRIRVLAPGAKTRA